MPKPTTGKHKVMKSKPYPYSKGDRVRDIYTGKVYTVKHDGYWQNYAGGGTRFNPLFADYTVELESIDPSQPTPWNKSRNLEPVGKHPCPTCGAANEIVNQCGCDPNNMPTAVPQQADGTLKKCLTTSES